MLVSRIRCLTLIAAGWAVSASTGAAQGQGSSQPAPQQPSTQAVPAASANSNKPATPASTADPKAKKPKKVWTEEEMGKLNGSISVVGDKNASSSGFGSTGTDSHGDHDAAWYRDQLAPLRSQMERVDTQIRDLEQAKLGGRENIARPMEKLQQQKAEIQAKIDGIEEQARKAGIAPGELR